MEKEGKSREEARRLEMRNTRTYEDLQEAEQRHGKTRICLTVLFDYFLIHLYPWLGGNCMIIILIGKETHKVNLTTHIQMRLV